jgi:hypothetical protein
MRPPSRWSNGSVSLAFNNPPYDWSSIEEVRNGQKRKLRHELLFIEGVTPKVIVGGHQVIIVPRGILGDEQLLAPIRRSCRTPSVGWYETWLCFRMAVRHYKQVVVWLAASGRIRPHEGCHR